MRKLWEFSAGRVSNFAFTGDYLVLSSGSRLLCFDRDGLVWSRKMSTTFYRDPYGDVAITALDANYPHIAAGTNFMDGKLYLFTIDGELLWEHQFATTASLGWRPEDVTAVKVGNGVVCAGTEFMNEYVYVYTVNRRRLFQKRVGGRVSDFLVLGGEVVMGTDSNLYALSWKGELLHSVKMSAEKLGRVGDVLVVQNREGVTAFDMKDFVEVWEHRAEGATVFCFDEVLVAAGGNLKCFAEDGELLWEKQFDGRIASLHKDGSCYYVGMKNRVLVLEDDLVEKIEIEGLPFGFGKGVVAITNNDEIDLYDYTE